MKCWGCRPEPGRTKKKAPNMGEGVQKNNCKGRTPGKSKENEKKNRDPLLQFLGKMGKKEKS